MAMAKAKQELKVPPIFSSFLDNFKDNFVKTMKKTIKEKIKKLEKMALEIALSFVFFFISIIFVLVSLMFFLKEYFHFGYSLSFMCVGITALLIAYAIYGIVNKE
jgi:high-affinity K+ transport system ATPase subunit B